MAAVDANLSPLGASEHQIQLRRAVIASTIGTASPRWSWVLIWSATITT
jgi:hypothetical protein